MKVYTQTRPVTIINLIGIPRFYFLFVSYILVDLCCWQRCRQGPVIISAAGWWRPSRHWPLTKYPVRLWVIRLFVYIRAEAVKLIRCPSLPTTPIHVNFLSLSLPPILYNPLSKEMREWKNLWWLTLCSRDDGICIGVDACTSSSSSHHGRLNSKWLPDSFYSSGPCFPPLLLLSTYIYIYICGASLTLSIVIVNRQRVSFSRELTASAVV